ncbi:MAG TPA: hypothetical protein VMM17_05720 [Gemmatimonadaceae bacterium]|nr:hypothetical protein [Gemmatimonadaceae bacterium]
MVLGALAVGALFGAAAVVLSPQGSGTRRDLGRQLRRLRRLARRDRTPWEKLRRTLDRAATHKRRAARRAQSSMAVAEDPIAR